jgi:hypothetical protein
VNIQKNTKVEPSDAEQLFDAEKAKWIRAFGLATTANEVRRINKAYRVKLESIVRMCRSEKDYEIMQECKAWLMGRR